MTGGNPVHRRAILEELRAFFRLAVPVAGIQLGMMAMGVVDVMMVGRTSPTEMAAVNIGHTYTFMFLGIGIGMLMALDPIIAQAWGARDEEAIRLGIGRGLLLCLGLSIPLMACILWVRPALVALKQLDDVVPIASSYAYAIIPGMPFFLIFTALKQALQAMHIVRPILVTIIATNILNAILNHALIFGSLPGIGPIGIAPMGAVGSAWATTISRFVMAAMVLGMAWPALSPYLGRWTRDSFRALLSAAPMMKLVKIGAPIGVQVSAEVGAFSVINFMVGVIGVVEASGSSITLNLASITFMVPLGISAAAAVRVGNAIGAGDQAGVRRAAWVAIALGAGFMAITGTTLALIPGPLSRLYTPDANVIAQAVLLLPLAAMFQVFDGIQSVSTGVLRGAGETRLPMLLHLAGFWFLGIPSSWYLGFQRGAPDARGVWWGLVVGLTAVALALVVRVYFRLKRRFDRV